MVETKQELKLEEIALDATFIPENVSADKALRLLLAEHIQLCVVVDEFGSVVGVLAMEDIIESILGQEIFEHDDLAVDMRELAKKLHESKKVKKGKISSVKLGNIYSKRDWGYAMDYVDAMWRMLQQKKPDDFVISTGTTYTVKSFVNKAAKHFDFDLIWKGKGLNEKAYDKNSKKLIVKIDKNYFRPCEVNSLIGDSTKAFKELGWSAKISLEDLVSDMIKHDKELAKKEALLIKKGFDLQIPTCTRAVSGAIKRRVIAAWHVGNLLRLCAGFAHAVSARPVAE